MFLGKRRWTVAVEDCDDDDQSNGIGDFNDNGIGDGNGNGNGDGNSNCWLLC